MDILFARTEYPAVNLSATAGAEAAYCQCTGDRDEQQDACGLFACGDAMLAVVADGMGGLARGGAAASLALKAAERESCALLAGKMSYDCMKAALEKINGDVYRSVSSYGIMGMAGTTLCAAAFTDRELRLFWSGDSRAYLWRDGKLRALTQDHVYARYLNELVAEGVISPADARTNPSRGHLTGYIGMQELEDYSITPDPMEMLKGDGLLLCTDGLYKCLEEEQVCRCMSQDAYSAAGALIKQIVKKRLKGQDNATALVLKWRD
jgi:PPM family protein phosphatase